MKVSNNMKKSTFNFASKEIAINEAEMRYLRRKQK